jgi:hypothetical protein
MLVLASGFPKLTLPEVFLLLAGGPVTALCLTVCGIAISPALQFKARFYPKGTAITSVLGFQPACERTADRTS